MAFSASGIYVFTVSSQMQGTSVTGGPINPATATGWKLALHSNSLTQGTAPINYDSTTPNWANTNEVTGTGWATGGISLTTIAGGSSATPTLTISSGSLVYDHTNDTSVASTTLSGVRGCIIYFDNATSPAALADAMFVAVTFGADYSTSNGTFGITWAAGGVAAIDLTP